MKVSGNAVPNQKFLSERSERIGEWGAFVDPDVALSPIEAGTLSGSIFAVKDVFDICGIRSSAGNPDWLRTHEPASETAPALIRLLKQGAQLKGTTQTDELMYSLNGENFHYGTPTNPAAPGRIPGGSSSGSAAAVAAGIVDFAIGTDTGGSVRIPSSYCGLYGFRPTHGAVSAEGVIPLARSFDTVGWMSSDAELLLHVGRVLLEGKNEENEKAIGTVKDSSVHGQRFTRFFTADEAWNLPEENDRQTLLGRLHKLAEWKVSAEEVRLTESGETLADWSAAFRILQGLEIWQEHGGWIKEKRPVFGPGIAERFEWASQLTESIGKTQEELRTRVRYKLAELLGSDGLLVIPTAPGPAPLLGLQGEKAENYRANVMQLSCIAGLSGLPQVTVPTIRLDGLPLGLSFIGGPGTDLKLLEWTAEQFAKEAY